MNTFNNAVIFSPERSNDLLGTTLFRITRAKNVLEDVKASYKEVLGVYTYKDGLRKEESSFLVEYDQHRNSDMLDTIKEFAFNQFDQESILHLDSNRNGTLIYKDGKTQNLGKLTSCSKEKAIELGNYTYTNDTYYIFEK